MNIHNIKYLMIFSFILLATLIGTAPAFAESDAAVIPSSFEELDLSNRLEVIVDQNQMKDEQILDQFNEFAPISTVPASGDISDATYWLKVNLANPHKNPRDLLLEIKKPHLSSVTLYSVENDQLIKEETMGYQLPFNTRNYKHRNMVFKLHLQPAASTIYLLKIQTDSFFQAPVSLWDPVAFSEANYLKQSFFGIFYGIMIAMIIYNSFLFISLKEKSYLYYILFISGFTIMQSIWDGFAFQWLWGDFPWWALRSNSFFILWSSFFALQFAKHFLQLREIAPSLNRIVTIFNIFCGASLFLPFFINVGIMTMLSSVIATIFLALIITIALKVRLATREAKYFIAAWSLLFIGVLLNLLAAYQLIPLSNLTLFAPKIGAVVEVLVLSLGLADKIKRITKEKEQETRRYYIHTLLQNSFKQMSALKEVKPLTESGLKCLMDITNLEKGLYLIKDGEDWKVLSKVGNIELTSPVTIEKRYLERIFHFPNCHEAANLFDISHFTGTAISIPISCKSHTGLSIVGSDKKVSVEPSVIDSLLPSFMEQFATLIENIHSYQTLKHSAMFDHLTNVFNRKYFLENATALYRNAAKMNQPVSLLLIDIDYFKRINDTYGHSAGDKAIAFVADQIDGMFKEKGIVGRYGGEEFIVFLPNCDRDHALEAANLLLETFRFKGLKTEDGNSLFLTVSIGLCSDESQNYHTIDEMIQHADKHLYQAKNNGRDQVSICEINPVL
ncbi:diguanylate cyclase [Bacillus sp. AK031]